MPLTLVTTVGAATANSYATVLEADTLAEEVAPPPEAWLASSADEKKRALVTACRRLEEERYPGTRVDATQALEWPRSGSYDRDRVTLIDTTVIPPVLKRGQIVLAFAIRKSLKVGEDGFAPSDLSGLTSLSLGSELSMGFDNSDASVGVPATERVMAQTIRPMLGNLVYAPQPRFVRG